MKIFKKGICFTGEIVGLSTEAFFRVSGMGINNIYKKLENGNNKNIDKIAKDVGEKVSNLIVKETQYIAKSADKLSNKVIDKTKDIANKTIVKEVKVYGDTKYFYDNKDLVNGEFKICE